MMNGKTFTNRLALAASTGALLILAGCSTVEHRISENPQLFQTLPARDQELVSRGQIRTGMSQDGVWLAWGRADARVAGAMRGQQTETWVYTTTTSVPSYGYGYGGYWGRPFGPWAYGLGYNGVIRTRHGHRFAFFGNPYYDPFYYPFFETVSYPYKTVTFANGRVVSFQYLVGPYR
ncbi:MAG TPA: hypothetical protein VJ719_06475 [Chthoniobacterales bacterium]|nr:hypothetical protein [Chthoniobacterales bacterium]